MKKIALVACFLVSYSYSMLNSDTDAELFIKDVEELSEQGVSDGFTTGHAFALFVSVKDLLNESDTMPPFKYGAFLATAIASFYSSMAVFANEIAARPLLVQRVPDGNLREYALRQHKKRALFHVMTYGVVPAVVSASCLIGSALQSDDDSREFWQGIGTFNAIIAGMNTFDVMRHGLLVHRKINKSADARDITRY